MSLPRKMCSLTEARLEIPRPPLGLWHRNKSRGGLSFQFRPPFSLACKLRQHSNWQFDLVKCVFRMCPDSLEKAVECMMWIATHFLTVMIWPARAYGFVEGRMLIPKQVISPGNVTRRHQNLAKIVTGGGTFGGQLELHHSSSPAETPRGCSSVVRLLPRAARVGLWWRNDGETAERRHNWNGREKKRERRKMTRGQMGKKRLAASDWPRGQFKKT